MKLLLSVTVLGVEELGFKPESFPVLSFCCLFKQEERRNFMPSEEEKSLKETNKKGWGKFLSIC